VLVRLSVWTLSLTAAARLGVLHQVCLSVWTLSLTAAARLGVLHQVCLSVWTLSLTAAARLGVLHQVSLPVRAVPNGLTILATILSADTVGQCVSGSDIVSQ